MKKFFEDVMPAFVVVSVILYGWGYFQEHCHIRMWYKLEPSAGYVWSDNNNNEQRMIWNKKEVIWKAGISYPDNPNVYSCPQEGYWIPCAGYKFINGTSATRWVKGEKHPDYNVISTAEEGIWEPKPGYKFIGNALNTRWEKGIIHPDYKAVSASEEGSWTALPGYHFINPNNSLATEWQKGQINPSNPNLIAGTVEGVWEPYERTTSGEKIGQGIAIIGAVKVFEKLFGESSIGDEAKKKGAERIIDGVIDKINGN